MKSFAQIALDSCDGDSNRTFSALVTTDGDSRESWCTVDQDWNAGATIVTFTDGSALIFSGPCVELKGGR